MTYLYVAVEVILINAFIFTAVFLVARKAFRQVSQMFKPQLPVKMTPSDLGDGLGL